MVHPLGNGFASSLLRAAIVCAGLGDVKTNVN